MALDGCVLVDNDNAVAADAPAAPLLLSSSLKDPTAMATTKTHNGMATASAATEEEEYDGCDSTNP